MSRKPSKPETRIEDYLDVMTGGNAALPQPILRIEFYYAFLAGMAVELPQPILDDEKLLAKICGMEVEAPTYIPGISPRLYAYMAKKGGQDVQVPDPILRLECYWYDYSAGSPPSVQEYTGAVPVTFVADGTPLLDYIISGNTVQDGTTTPDSPIMPQGTGERTGNLVFVSVDNETHFSNYNQYTISDGTITVTGRMLIGFKVKITPDTTYTVSAVYRAGVLMRVRQYTEIPNDWTNGFINQPVNTNLASATFTTSSEAEWILVAFYSEVVGGTIDSIMLNTGSTPLPYEPYGYKLDISSANITTPVYLGEVETTRAIRKYVFNGTEGWQRTSNGAYYLPSTSNPMSNYKYISADISINSHFPSQGTVTASSFLNDGKSAFFYIASSGTREYYIAARNIPTADDFKAYLAAQYAAGTPVTVWYVLSTEETGIVNEPLMKIGDYADTLSMEQTGAQIPTANGSTTLDVETTVKPSEVYIKYRGEAVATLSALPAEVSSPEATTEEESPEETEEEENER